MSEEQGVRPGAVPGRTGELAVHEATLADLTAVVEIYNQAVADRESTCDLSDLHVDERASWLEDHRWPYGAWVVVDNADTVVAWATLSPYSGKECFRGTAVTATYVDRQHRGDGIGRWLRGYVIDEAIRRPFHTLLARIWAMNERSVRLSYDYGFVEAGRLRAVAQVGDDRVDVIWFQKTLRDAAEDHTSVFATTDDGQRW